MNFHYDVLGTTPTRQNQMDCSLTQPDLPPRRCTEPQPAAEQNNSVGHSMSVLEQNKYYCPAEAGKLSLSLPRRYKRLFTAPSLLFKIFQWYYYQCCLKNSYFRKSKDIRCTWVKQYLSKSLTKTIFTSSGVEVSDECTCYILSLSFL